MTGGKISGGIPVGRVPQKKERFPTVTRDVNKEPEWSFPMKYR